MKITRIIWLGVLAPLVALTVASTPAAAQQQTTGIPGSPSATTTIDGRYLPPPAQPIVLWRANYHHAISDFCNNICQERTQADAAIAVCRSQSYSITSSARASTVAGMSMPSVFAVLRLITSSYLVGVCTGSSAGFSPL